MRLTGKNAKAMDRASRAKPSKMFVLRLFVTGITPRSMAAIENVPSCWSGSTSIRSVAGSKPWKRIWDSIACRSEGNAPASIRMAGRSVVGR